MKTVRNKIFSKCTKTLNQFSSEVDIQMSYKTYNRIGNELMVDKRINYLRNLTNQIYHIMKTHFKQNGQYGTEKK